MRKTTKIAVAVGALALVGAGAVSTLAVADARDGDRGPGKQGYSQHMRGQHHARYQHDGRRHHARGGHRSDRGYVMLMERFDADKDGKLTQDELDTSRKELVAKFDTDKDGKLTLEEFQSLWLDFMHKRMVRGFQRIDEDGDAVITIEEFIKPYGNVLERMDRNGDGVLDKEDRRARRGPPPGQDDDNRPGPHGPGGPGGPGPQGPERS